MIIDCISDTHGHYPKLEGGDLLIVAGDLTARDGPDEFTGFFSWISVQNYKKAIIIAGNHDNCFQKGWRPFLELDTNNPELEINYLCDSDTEFEGLKIWGSPWTPYFEDVNPRCTAFMLPEEELEAKFAMIPDDVDILVAHGPPYGIQDRTRDGRHVGSKSLQMELFKRLRPKLLVFGHVHESYGIEPKGGFVECAVNCSHVNERYEPVNKPIRIEI